MLILLLATLIGLTLGLLGGGGSILTLPLLIYGLEVEPKAAIAERASHRRAYQRHGHDPLCAPRGGRLENRLGVRPGRHARRVRRRLARFVPARVLLLVFAALMLGTAFAMLCGRGAARHRAEPCARATMPFHRILSNGLVVGGVTGLVGVGGGFLVVPALHLLGRLPARSGCHLRAGHRPEIVRWTRRLSATRCHRYGGRRTDNPARVLGTVLGVLLAGRVGAAKLRRGFALFVLTNAIFIAHHALRSP